MLNRCRLAVNSGRQSRGLAPLTDAQVKRIDDDMSKTMRRLADPVRGDPQWQSYSADMRMIKAAEAVMRDIEAEAARKVANAQLQVLKTAETEIRIQDRLSAQQLLGGATKRTDALIDDMHESDTYINGIKRENTSRLMDLIEAADSRRGASIGRQALMILFDAQNPVMTRDLALEVFSMGKAGTGNPEAKAGAAVWLEVTEAMRKRFNAAGGDVGQLDYGYLPQAHDMTRVLAKGQDAWANDVLPMLDRTRYLREDGSRMSDAEVLDVLRGAWETISTDGANKSAPGAYRGPGARANRGSESREIHFKDGEAYLAYQKAFGTGSMYDAMIGHIGRLARDIGLVEKYGPNPEAQMRLQFDLATRADGERQTFAGQIAEGFKGAEAQWRVLSGASGSPQYARVSQIMTHARNIQTFGKLQGAMLSSVTDLGTYFVSTGYNKLGYWSALQNLTSTGARKAANLATFGAYQDPAVDFLNTHGMMAESLISDLNRWSGENIANSWSGRIVNATMRLSLMNAWTDSLRRAFQLTHMRAVGKMRTTDWANLDEYDQWRMSNKGITPEDWAVLQRVQPENFRGFDMITPDGIYATGDARAAEVAAKYLGMISDESEMAVLNPDLTTRAIATGGGQQAGTPMGELARAVAQFKSFPIAMISRHFGRMLETPQGLQGAPMMANRLAYGGAMMVTLTALGAIVFQIKQIVSGKDPVDMTGDGGQDVGELAKFWARAVAQGGALSFLGDFLLNDPSESYGRATSNAIGAAAGPLIGAVAEATVTLGLENVWELAQGKQTNFGAEAIRFGRSHAPLVNLWYAKTALDHAGLYALQENLSPGYLRKMEARAAKNWDGQQYWWRPQDDLPQRLPNMGAAVNQR